MVNITLNIVAALLPYSVVLVAHTTKNPDWILLQSKNPFKLIQQHSSFPNEKHGIESTLRYLSHEDKHNGRYRYRKISQPRSLHRSFLKKITYNQHVLYRILVIAECKVSSVHRRAARICVKGGQKLIDIRGVARILVRGGKRAHKISSKFARISVRSGDI